MEATPSETPAQENTIDQTSKCAQAANPLIEIIKDFSSIIYKTSNSCIGVEASKIVPQRPVLHGFNGKFSAVSNRLMSHILNS